MTTRTRRKAIEADPQALPRLVSAREVKKVKANIPELVNASDRDAERMRDAIETEFGFVPTLEYCHALIEFVDTLMEKQ